MVARATALMILAYRWRLEEFRAPDAAGQNDSHDHRQNHGDHAAHQPDHQHIFHGADKSGVAHDFEIVPQAVEAPGRCRCRQALHLKEAHDHCPKNRIDIHEQQAKNGWQDKQENHGFVLFKKELVMKGKVFLLLFLFMKEK